MDIAQLQAQISEAGVGSALPPVDQWNPEFCGNMNLVIKRSGQWWHEGTPFTRAKLVKLLSSVIKREGEDYFLVTPVEKIGISVEDVPFVVIDEHMVENQENKKPQFMINTQVGDQVTISQKHPVELREFEGNWLPYCHIRRNLWARVHQNVLYRWFEQATEKRAKDGTLMFTLQSGDYEFCIGRLAE